MPTWNKKTIGLHGGALICAAAVFLSPMIRSHEGDRLKAYKDSAGIWSVCEGHAFVQPGLTLTQQQCDAIDKSDEGKFLAQVYQLAGNVPPQMLAADADAAYNIGIGEFRKTAVLRYQLAGSYEDSCYAFSHLYTVAGRDCTIRANGCYGIITRRKDEATACLASIGEKYDDGSFNSALEAARRAAADRDTARRLVHP